MTVVPGTLNYWDPDDARLDGLHVIVAGRGSVLNNQFYQRHRAAGRRVVQYINFIDAWDPGPFDKRFITGAPTIPSSGAGVPSNWGGYGIVDISNAAWRDKAVEAMKWTLDRPELDDLMIDVFGTRLYSTGWDRMSSAQRTSYAAGARDLANRFGAIRDQYRPTARLYANGTWNGEGNPALCPAVENHDHEMPTKAGDFWWKYLNDLPWDRKGQPCGIVYTKSLAAAEKWAKIPGVGVVCIHPTTYYGPSGLALPYATLTPRSGATPPPPPPPPPPADCSAVIAERDRALVDLTNARAARDSAQARAQNLDAQLSAAVLANAAISARAVEAEADRDTARAALAEATMDIKAIEDDLRKIKGSASSSAGNAADRLRGVKGRAAKALERASHATDKENPA